MADPDGAWLVAAGIHRALEGPSHGKARLAKPAQELMALSRNGPACQAQDLCCSAAPLRTQMPGDRVQCR